MKRFPWITYSVVLALIALVALAPVISVAIAAAIANSHGCRVDEGGIYPCVINGTDWGQTLATLGVLGWLMLLTLPAGALAFVVWLVVLILHRARWKKRQTTTR